MSFTNPLWKKVSPEAFQFVKRLSRPIEATDSYEHLLLDRFILLNEGPVPQLDLPIDNIAKIHKLHLLHSLESAMLAIKQNRCEKKNQAQYLKQLESKLCEMHICQMHKVQNQNMQRIRFSHDDFVSNISEINSSYYSCGSSEKCPRQIQRSLRD